MSVIFSMYNFFVIWLWFIVENICDISILMHNLPDCSLLFFEKSKLTIYPIHLLVFGPLQL